VKRRRRRDLTPGGSGTATNAKRTEEEWKGTRVFFYYYYDSQMMMRLKSDFYSEVAPEHFFWAVSKNPVNLGPKICTQAFSWVVRPGLGWARAFGK
jgi:hypothetical protein